MQANSSALANSASATSSATTKGASAKASTQKAPISPRYQVKGGSSAPGTTSSIAHGGATMQGQASNAPEEYKLATAELFRPLGMLPTLGGTLGGIASSTSPSTALFGQPLFAGLPKLPDGSPEETAMPTTLMGANSAAGATGTSSLGGGGSGLFFGPLSGGEDGGNGALDRAQDLRSGQISASFVPLGGNSGRLMGGPLLFGDGGGAAIPDQPSAGEIITGTYATYHGPIDLMVPQLAQDHDKSLDTLSDLNVSKAKTFRSHTEPKKTVLAFLAQNGRNISFVINQDDLVDNVLSVAVMEQLGFKKESGMDMSHINDFTLLDFQYLIVLMNQGRVVVFDCSMVLEGSARQVRYINQDQIKPAVHTAGQDLDAVESAQQSGTKPVEQLFTRIESMEASKDFDSTSGITKARGGQRPRPQSSAIDAARNGSEPRRVLVFGKQAHRMLCLEFPRSDSPDMDMMDHPVQAELQIPSKLQNRIILDFAVVDAAKTAAILFNDSLIAVFDLALRTAVFKAKYNDATDNISQLYFVTDKHLEAPLQQPASSPSSDTTLMGFFLLIETKMVQKDTPKIAKNGEQNISVSRQKHLRKLHLVQIQQTQVTTRSKIEKRDKIEQIDALSFGEETPKLVQFVRCKNKYGVPNYFAFLLTRERVKANGALKLITVKMRWAPNEANTQNEEDDDEHSDSEETKATKVGGSKEDRASSGGFQSKWKLKFDYVTSLGPKIENFRGDKQKPDYLNVIEAAEEVYPSDDEDDMDENQDGGQGGNAETDQSTAVFYIYTGVGSQSVVFKRSYSDLAQAHGDEKTQRQQIEEARAALLQGAAAKKQRKGNKTAGATGVDGHQNYDDYLEKMNQEHQRDKEHIKAELAKQIKDAVSEIDVTEDPAIASISQSTTKGHQQNPETQGAGNQYKKKGTVGANGKRPTSAKGQRPVAGAAAGAQATQQPVYKTKGNKLQNASSHEVAEVTEKDVKDLLGIPTETVSQSQKQQKVAKDKGVKDQNAKDNTVQATPVSVPPTKKQQQDQIIENYQELNKKFTELHMKMNSLQQQVKAQKDLQIQVEQTISKAVKTALPEIIKKQVEETVTPLMQKQTELLDQQLRQTLIPRIEAHMQRLIGGGNSTAAGQASSASLPPLSVTGGVTSLGGSASTLTDQSVRKIIHHEFKQAMATQIMPELERELKQMLNKVKEPITNVNKIFYEKLINEEQKSDHMVQVFEQRLQFAQQQAQQQQSYQSPYAQPHLQAPPPMSQSFSLHPQTSQASYATQHIAPPPQPIAIYHQHPQPHYQIQMPAQHGQQQQMLPQQHQQLFNVSQDQSMITGQLQAASFDQPTQILTPANGASQQPQPTQQQLTNQPTASFHTHSSFGPQQAAQMLQFVQPAANGGQQVVQQTQLQPQQLQQMQMAQQQQNQQMLQQQQQTLQPTNTSFVPTTSTSTTNFAGQQQNVAAPTFTPQATAFHPTNSTNNNGANSATNAQMTPNKPTPMINVTTNSTAFAPAMKTTMATLAKAPVVVKSTDTDPKTDSKADDVKEVVENQEEEEEEQKTDADATKSPSTGTEEVKAEESVTATTVADADAEDSGEEKKATE